MAEASKQQSSYVGNPTSIPGKMITTEWPTPGLDDRIVKLRKDFRKFPKLPRKGSKYNGPNADKFCDFRFATAKATDQIGWIDLYYLNERKNQDEYNFEITYPYASKDYPTVTRTYVVLRGDQRSKEPDADSKDPVYGDLSLTDHKVIRLQQNELDALFVGVQRVYERLPSPVIVSHQINQYQQDVTVEEQEDIAPDFPTVDALTEIDKLDRKTTAKAKTTKGTVTEVFPDTNYKVSRDDAVIPYRHRKFLAALPSVQISQIQAGDASQPVLADVDWDASDHQITKYKHQFSRTVRNLISPISLLEYRLTPDQQKSTTTETWARGMQKIDPAPLLIEADVIQLGNHESVKSVTTIPSVFPQSVYETEIPDPVPLKFRVMVPVTSSTQTTIGTAVPQALGTGELERRDEQTKAFWHRLMIKSRDITQLPVSLVSYDLTPEQQIGMVTETLARGLQTLSPNELLIKGSVDNLGNNTSLKSTTTVPTIFQKQEYKTSIPDIIPERFRVALPTYEASYISAGTALPIPQLGTGELERSDAQETEYKHRISIKARAISGAVVLVSYKMTKDKQIETVLETFNQGIQTISPNALTVEADVTNLGNNTSVRSVGTVERVFPEQSFEVTIPDLIPPEFRALVPTNIVEVTVPGQANLPPLGTGDISKSQKQVNEFVFRGRTETRAGVSLPKQFTNKELTKEFGGGETDVIRTLDLVGASSQVLDQGLIVLKSEVKNLGNGMSLKETQQLHGIAWPPVPSSLWDDNMRVQYTETKKTVNANSAPTPDPGGGTFAWLSEVKGIDKWKAENITINKPTPAYTSPETALITREFRPYRFPGWLAFSGTGYYTRGATAVLVEHVIRTWWVKSVGTPTITYDRIITGDVIINNLAGTGLEYARNVLHDGFVFGALSFPPTTPTATEYALGQLTGTEIIDVISLVNPGSGCFVGQHFNVGSVPVTVTAIGIADSILNYSPVGGSFGYPVGEFGPFGGGCGSAFVIRGYEVPTYGGTPWIGTERIIDASVVPEKEPNIWKCQTKSVVMQ